MNTLHIEAGRHLYGGAAQVLMLLRGLTRRPGRHRLVCARGSAVAAAAAAAGLDALPLPLGGELDIAAPLRLAALLRREPPDLVHVHSRRGADLWGALAAAWTCTPALLSRRVDNPERGPYRWKYRRYRRVIAISEEIRRLLIEREGLPAEQVVCIPSAVDTDRFRPEPAAHAGRARRTLGERFALPDDAPLLGVVAQLIERKGQHLLLQALPVILRAAPRTRLVLFGRGPRDAALRRQCAGLGVADKVIFAGLRDDIDALLPGLDLVVHPALMEGLGVALLEAAACGVALVASRAGGIPEIVVDGDTGLLVPPGDVDALAAAVVALLADPLRRRRLGANGRARALEKFSAERMVAANYRVYQDLLGAAA